MDKAFSNLDNIKSLSEKISAVFNQNELLRTAINTSHEGIAILDEKGTYIYMNTAHATMFGYEEGELIGKSWEILYESEDILHFRSTVFPLLAEDGKWNGKYIAKSKDGVSVYEELYLTTLPNGGMICTCRVDICNTCEYKISKK